MILFVSIKVLPARLLNFDDDHLNQIQRKPLNQEGYRIHIQILPKQNESSNLGFLFSQNRSTKRIHKTNLSKTVYKKNPQNKSFETSMDLYET